MMNIQAIPAFEDNYIWLIPFGERQAAVVDPGDAAPVLATLKQLNLELVAVLVTHHHRDHIGGIPALLEQFPEATIYGPANEGITTITTPLHEGDQITLGEFELTTLEVPGHTQGHLAYYGENALFCGDTLFTAGCGKLFGGTAPQLHNSLNKIKTLPTHTNVYCAHEYTLTNLRYARLVEPNNGAILQRQSTEMAKRQNGIATVPATLELELATNPFLRCNLPEVKAAAEQFANHPLHNEGDVFKVLRYWRDCFS